MGLTRAERRKAVVVGIIQNELGYETNASLSRQTAHVRRWLDRAKNRRLAPPPRSVDLGATIKLHYNAHAELTFYNTVVRGC